MLIAARGVQGIGGAAMYATTIALLNAAYQGRDRGVAFGIWGAVSGAAAAAGPILGGLLTEGLSWRWIFFVNLPVSVVALVAYARGRSAADRPGLPAPGWTCRAWSPSPLGRRGRDLRPDPRRGRMAGAAAPTLGLLALGLAACAVFVVIERAASAAARRCWTWRCSAARPSPA